MNTGDTAFMLIATAMVMLMTPGLALFYGGMVRSKNVLATIMQSFLCLGIVSILWVLFGYSLAFGPDVKGLIGDLSWAGLQGVGTTPGSYAPTIPHLLFCAFQLMFAVITPALITGAFAERIKFTAYLAFTVLWTTLVYFPICHWVWGGGWMGAHGGMDFAGGTVIHINSGAGALVAALMVGKRQGWGREPFHPHNLGMTLLGAGILWFGWFGFNAGSALSAGEIATVAFFTTQIASGAAAVSWIVMEWLTQGRPTTLGAASGAVAGLATVTPAAGFIGPVSAILIGMIAGLVCYFMVSLIKNTIALDDSLDVVGIHGVGGVIGTICLGLFASKAVNPSGADGLFAGNPGFLGTQIFGVMVVAAYAFVVSWVLLKIIDATMGLRVSAENEVTGLDLSEHSETAYN